MRAIAHRVASLPHRARIGRWVAISAAILIASVTLTPGEGPAAANVAPLCLVCGSYGGADAILNVLLFAPLGFGLALWGVRAGRALLTALAVTILIETLQWFIIPGRDATLGDVAMNFLGAAFGFVAGARITGLLLPTPDGAARLLGVWTIGWLGLQALSAYALVPAPTAGAVPAAARRAQLAGDLEPLCFAARERRRRLAEPQVPQAHLLQVPQRPRQARVAVQAADRLVHGPL